MAEKRVDREKSLFFFCLRDIISHKGGLKMAYRIYNRGLAKSQLKKIKDREYTRDEIEYTYELLYKHYQLKKKTWIRVMIFMLVVVMGM